MVIRHSEAMPRRGFFSGNLKDGQATARHDGHVDVYVPNL
jgi:hypothetical protein